MQDHQFIMSETPYESIRLDLNVYQYHLLLFTMFAFYDFMTQAVLCQ